MNSDIGYLIGVVGTFFAILDPFGFPFLLLIPKIIILLGIPLYVGPGSIAAAVLFGSNAPSSIAFLGGLLIIFSIVLIITILNISSDLLARILGRQGIEILVRQMGLILAAIAV
jgi:multiple antibiotic resistance protein